MKTIRMKQNSIKKGSTNYISDYLQTLGIAAEDVVSFIDMPRPTDEDDPFTLENIQHAINIAIEFCSRSDAKVFVQVDSDCDGYTSAAIIISYLRRRFPALEINYRLHKGKEHGIILDTISEGTTLVIIPDAGSNQVDEINALAAKGVAVIVLDHHEVNESNGPLVGSDVVIVNNQISPRFKNKYMSGAGITYMFCRAMDYVANTNYAEDYRDLAAIGIIADAMNMTSIGNNYLAYYGLSNIKNKFMLQVAMKQERGIPDPGNLTKIGVAFYIAPVINGVIRSGDEYDKKMVFRAMIEEDADEIFVHEWRGKTTNEDLFQHAARLALNAKSRQDSAKKKSFEWLCSKIEENGWQNDNIIIATMDTKESAKVSANVTGLIAMELAKHYNRPCLVLRETEFEGRIMYGGSGRNGNFFGFDNLLEFLRESGLVYYVEGHANAHGVFIEPEKIQLLRNYANAKINPQIFDDTVFEVDYWFHTGEPIDRDMLYEFASYDALYGNSIPQPKFAFDFNFKNTDVRFMGKNGTSVKITVDKVSFVIFSDSNLTTLLQTKTFAHAQIIGRPQLNEWMGNVSVQVIVDDIEIKDVFSTDAKSDRAKVLDLI